MYMYVEKCTSTRLPIGGLLANTVHCTIDKRGGRGLETRNARVESGVFRH